MHPKCPALLQLLLALILNSRRRRWRMQTARFNRVCWASHLFGTPHSLTTGRMTMTAEAARPPRAPIEPPCLIRRESRLICSGSTRDLGVFHLVVLQDRQKFMSGCHEIIRGLTKQTACPPCSSSSRQQCLLSGMSVPRWFSWLKANSRSCRSENANSH